MISCARPKTITTYVTFGQPLRRDSSINTQKHAILTLLSSIVISSASPASPPGFVRNLVELDQVPVNIDNKPITRTLTVTHTHFEINVVSTVYRTRPQPTPLQKHADFIAVEEKVPVWSTQLENPECNVKACVVCRLINNCEAGSTEW